MPARHSLHDDLAAIRAGFDGIVLYGYEPEITPIILEEAKALHFRAVVLGIWDVKSREEIQGVAELVQQYSTELALAVCVGNEGVFFKRYQIKDVVVASSTLRSLIGNLPVVITTSEPYAAYDNESIRDFGDVLFPNIHPAFDARELKPAEAAAWTRKRARLLAELSGKPVLVKETGLPHGGADDYSPRVQSAFWEAYLKDGVVEEIGTRTESIWVSFAAAFEFTDLPWKREQSGIPVEEFWGLFGNPDRVPYPAFYVWSGRKWSEKTVGVDRERKPHFATSPVLPGEHKIPGETGESDRAKGLLIE